MSRIFTTLASVLGLALCVTFALGIVVRLASGGGLPAIQEDSTYFVHFTLGLFTAIGGLLVHCLIFTYFLGTGRWVKEVALAYGIADAPLPRRTRDLKRRTFPLALAAMLVTIACAAAGAGARRQEWPWELHATLAVGTLLVNLWAFRVEYHNVRQNAGVIEDVLREVDAIRAARGLPANAEALREEVDSPAGLS